MKGRKRLAHAAYHPHSFRAGTFWDQQVPTRAGQSKALCRARACPPANRWLSGARKHLASSGEALGMSLFDFSAQSFRQNVASVQKVFSVSATSLYRASQWRIEEETPPAIRWPEANAALEHLLFWPLIRVVAAVPGVQGHRDLCFLRPPPALGA